MNLDELKIQLNKKLEGNQGFDMVVGDATTLNTIKTSSIADKIKKSLVTEIIFSIIFILAFLYVCLTTMYSSVRIYFSVFVVVISFFLVLIIYLLKKTNDLVTSSLPIKDNLKRLHSLLTEFVKRCFQFTMLLIPICLIFSGYLGYTDTKNNIDSFNVLPAAINSKKQIIILIIFMIAFFISMYYFTKWYLKKLYGNHLDQLKLMIEQLEA